MCKNIFICRGVVFAYMVNRKIKKAIKALNFALFSVAHVLSSMVYKPRKQQKKIIGFAGARFTGNLKYLYQEMAKYNNVKVFFVTGNKADIEKLKKAGIDAHFYMDTKSIPLFLVTNAWVTSTGYNYIPFVGLIRRIIPFYTGKRGSKWIDLWHAVEAKDIGREKSLADYDVGFVTSEFYKQYYSKKKAEISDKLKITGDSRTDSLIKKNWNKKELIEKIGIPLSQKNILYAPTWGHRKRKVFLPWQNIEKNIEDFDEFCEKNNCSFLIRMHPNWYVRNPDEKKKLEDGIKRSKHIFDLSPQKYMDVQHILYITNVLITDWSSIANDFILLNRPIIFIDAKLPVKELILKPEERAGYIVRNKQEFFEKLKESIDYPKKFEEKRKILMKKLHKYLDGNSSKRCAEAIIKLLKKSR